MIDVSASVSQAFACSGSNHDAWIYVSVHDMRVYVQ